MTQRHAVVAGGGIGGLSAALALARQGWQVSVYEQAKQFREVGAGLQISPNGMRVLEHFGIARQLGNSLFEPEAIELREGRSGRRVFCLPMRGYAQKRWRARYIQIHRADLQAALLQAVQELGHVRIFNGARAIGYSHQAQGAVLHLENSEDVFADLLIGADGLHSVIRERMLGRQQPRFTGYTAWRGVVPVAALGNLAPPPCGCVWSGTHQHAVTTRIRAGREVNFVGVVAQKDALEENWQISGDRAQARADFSAWHPTLEAIIERSPNLFRWGLYDRQPVAQWSDGAVALLGDAAHPMLPSMAQGAVQALEDVAVLSVLLQRNGNLANTLAQYSALRHARVARIQKRSLTNLQIFHTSGPISKMIKFGALQFADTLSKDILHSRQDWVYQYDPFDAARQS